MSSKVIAIAKITTRFRPTQSAVPQAVEEVLTTHAALCPLCSRETRVGFGEGAVVYGGCVHFQQITQHRDAITLSFGEAA